MASVVNRLPVRIIETQEGAALEYAEDANLGHLFTVLDQLGFELHIQLVRKDGTSKPATRTTPPPAIKHRELPAPPSANGKNSRKKPAANSAGPMPPILADSQLGKLMACFQGDERRTTAELKEASGLPRDRIHQVILQAKNRGAIRKVDFGVYVKV